MNISVLKDLLAVPTVSYDELPMVLWLVDYLKHHIPGVQVTVDEALNVYVTKGKADYFPCVAAHIDSVHQHAPVRIVEDGDRLIGFDTDNQRTGIGADDKAGVFVCLNLLERFENIRAVFFATEEVGCVGARLADPAFFSQLAYLIEFDCPSRHMVSYSCGGRRLFANEGAFIKKALPSLQRHGSTLWQDHPYTDVMIIRERFPLSCLNLSCGYYNWHARTEFVSLHDLRLAIAQGTDLLNTLDPVSYEFPVCSHDPSESLVPVTGLLVPPPLNHAEFLRRL